MDSHLSVVLDLSPSQWHLSAPSLSLSAFVSQLTAFLNAHIASQHENTLAVFGAFPGKSVMLHAATDARQTTTIDPNSYPPFRLLDHTLVSRIRAELDSLDPDDAAPCALVGALTKALCYINRLGQQTDPRILVLSVSPDLSTSYIPIMNAIFSAQKLKVTIDACQIYGPETVFLQQAAHLTGGSYLHLERRDALLQYLIMSFLPPPSIRKIMAVPTQDRIDFRAACFCHKDIVDIGYVCSVCLSIFCKPSPVCSTCKTKFPIKTLQRLNALRGPPTTASARPSPAPTPQPHARSASSSSIATPAADAASLSGFAPGSGAPNRMRPSASAGGGLPSTSAISAHRNGTLGRTK